MLANSNETSRPRVLVLLAVHNGGLWLERQVNSILEQRGVTVHVVGSDDGSTDNSAELLQKYLEEGRLTSISPLKPKQSASRNFFWMISAFGSENYDFVAFSDHDDIWYPEKLESACFKLIQKKADCYSCSTVAEWPNGRQSILKQSARKTRYDFFFEGGGQGCTYVLSKVFYDRLQAFVLKNKEALDAVHYHDWAVYALARVWNAKWHFDPKPFIRYRQHGQNDTGARHSIVGVRRRIKAIQSGWYGEQMWFISKICVLATDNKDVHLWSRLLSKGINVKRQVQLLNFIIHGRRKILDRVLVGASALVGWL